MSSYTLRHDAKRFFLLATPVIAMSMVLIVMERLFSIGVFHPKLRNLPPPRVEVAG
jgi:hypothetical protein